MPADILTPHFKPAGPPPVFPPDDWRWLMEDKQRSYIVPFTEGYGRQTSCAFQQQHVAFHGNNSNLIHPIWRGTESGLSTLMLDPAGPQNFGWWRMPGFVAGAWLNPDLPLRHGRTWFAVMDYNLAALPAQKHTLLSMGSERIYLDAAAGTFVWENYEPILNPDMISPFLPFGDTSLGHAPGVVVGRSNPRGGQDSVDQATQMWLGNATDPGFTIQRAGNFASWAHLSLGIGGNVGALKGQTEGWTGNIYLAGFCNFPWTDEQITQLFRDPFGMLRPLVDLPASLPEASRGVFRDARGRLYTTGPDCRQYMADAPERALTDEARARLYTDQAPERPLTDDAEGAGEP